MRELIRSWGMSVCFHRNIGCGGLSPATVFLCGCCRFKPNLRERRGFAACSVVPRLPVGRTPFQRGDRPQRFRYVQIRPLRRDAAARCKDCAEQRALRGSGGSGCFPALRVCLVRRAEKFFNVVPHHKRAEAGAGILSPMFSARRSAETQQVRPW